MTDPTTSSADPEASTAGAQGSTWQRMVFPFLLHIVPEEVIETIADYTRARAGFPSDEVLAEFLDVEPGRVDDWKRGHVPPDAQRQLLRDFAVAVSELGKVYETEVIPAWLTAKPIGDSKAPIELLWEGNLAEVLQLINASSNAAYS
jgi:hypothetical protein